MGWYWGNPILVCYQHNIPYEDWDLYSNQSAQIYIVKREAPVSSLYTKFLLMFFFFLNTHACYYTGPRVTFYSVMKPVNMCLLFHSIWSQCVECHYSWEELYNVPIQPPSSSHIYLSFSLTATALLSSMLFALLFSPPSLRSIHSLTHSARCNG